MEIDVMLNIQLKLISCNYLLIELVTSKSFIFEIVLNNHIQDVTFKETWTVEEA